MDNRKEAITKPHTDPAETFAREDSDLEVGADQSKGSPAIPNPEEPGNLAAAHRKLVAEKEQLYDRLLRKQAELENYRKRVQREKEDFLQHATAELVRALLPTLDGFERALKHRDSKVPEQFYEGMKLIYSELLEVLGRTGLSPVETVGKLFDPHLHQAVETVEAPGYRDQEVVEELQRGYKLKHRLLRPAIVKVAVQSRKERPGAESSHSSPPGRSD